MYKVQKQNRATREGNGKYQKWRRGTRDIDNNV